MRSVLTTVLDAAAGALEVVPGPDGAVLHRSSRTTRSRLTDPGFDFMSAVPSGVRIEADTDAHVIELDVELTKVLLAGTTSAGAAFDLVVDGVLRAPVVTTEETLIVMDPVSGATTFVPAGPTTVRLEIGAPGISRAIEIWLPASTMLKLRDVRIPDGATLRPAASPGPLWVHHGSSISQCSEADRPTGTWPAIVARGTGHRLLNLALGGQCHLDQAVARTIRDLPATVVSLELGINVVNADSMRTRAFVSAFHGFLDTIRDGHPRTPVVVITPIVCPAAEEHPGPTRLAADLTTRTVDRPAELAEGALSLTAVRGLLGDHVRRRVAEGDTNLYLVDGLTLFGPADAADLPDGLHPSSRGYQRIAARFEPAVFGPGGVLTR
ncbi:SGNH/GDSL hydrolase family protein [Actinoplanes sp. NPDC051851]|uniref:SGNH/GDSL hydrolase family protein n=1 Tax=Actinoplanes sp. NPDC051851 TaxID=3154753 RepID=UPI00342C7335